MYTYLNQKYGLKSLIVEWAAAILNGVKAYSKEDHDVNLFSKIMANECDEEYRFIQQSLKETLFQIVKSLLKEKHPFKTEAELNKLADQATQSHATIEESIWKRALEKLYNQNEVELLTQKLYQIMDMKRNSTKSRLANGMPYGKYAIEAALQVQLLTGSKKMSRDELNQAL